MPNERDLPDSFGATPEDAIRTDRLPGHRPDRDEDAIATTRVRPREEIDTDEVLFDEAGTLGGEETRRVSPAEAVTRKTSPPPKRPPAPAPAPPAPRPNPEPEPPNVAMVGQIVQVVSLSLFVLALLLAVVLALVLMGPV